MRADPLNNSNKNECNVMELLQQMMGTASQVQVQPPVTVNTPGYNYNGYGANGYNGINGYPGYGGYGGYGGGTPCDTNGGYGYGK
ncbi:hypothetical protein HA402_004166 [Bradysia odoriphaga]|nr:hypothetical protein HA402_004166 [Bradysia odoriphaga]